MRRIRLVAGTLLVTGISAALTVTTVAAALSLGVAPAHAQPVPDSVTMNDCVDAIVRRAGLTTLVRPAVPERYGLSPLNPAGRPPGSAVSFFIIDIYCEDVTVHGRRSVPTTTSYVVSQITSIDGQPVPVGTHYCTLYIATNNPQLFALFRSAGLPVEFLRTISTTVTPLSDTSTQVAYNIDSDEFGHTYTVASLPPQEPYRFDPGGTWLYDGKHGTCSITWINHLSPIAPAIISGSQFGSTLSAWLVGPSLTLSNVRFPDPWRTGDHDVTLACDSDDVGPR
jgi:hypothetical protein